MVTINQTFIQLSTNVSETFLVTWDVGSHQCFNDYQLCRNERVKMVQKVANTHF